MGPIVKEVASSFEGKSVRFVNFDFTSDETKKAAKEAAAALGVTGTFDKYAPNTGYALIYDTKAQKVLTKLKSDKDVAAWTKVLNEKLGS